MRTRFSIFIGCLWAAGSMWGATLPSDWKYAQPFEVTQAGLQRISVPIETLDAARSGLEDLRLTDPTGREVPYVLDRVQPARRMDRAVKSFQVALTAAATVMTLETGFEQPVDGVTLVSPAKSFVKAVNLDGSADGNRWQLIAAGLPIYRQTDGASQLHLPLAARIWPYLRLTVDDRRSVPVPFSGATVHGVAVEAPSEPVAVTIAGREEAPGRTRLTLRFPTANLQLANLDIETPEPLFARSVTLAVRQVQDNQIREITVASGSIYRLSQEGRTVSANLTLSVEALLPAREAVLLIQNLDSPPLSVATVRASRRPVYLVFQASQPGNYQLLSGSRNAESPRYDLATMRADLKNAPLAGPRFSSLINNPAYQPREAFPEVPDSGASLDAIDWRFRKLVQINRNGVQQLELDPDILARAQPGLADVRLVRGGRQVPFVLEQTSITRVVTPQASPITDPQHPTRSRWKLELPQPALPVIRLVCTPQTRLFKRDMVLFEEVADERGEKHQRSLGHATWQQTADASPPAFSLAISDRPSGDTLWLATDNGDNPAIELSQFQFERPVSRIWFKAATENETFLYYGNPGISFPQYDLSLVAGQVLAADNTVARLGPQEQLKGASWQEKYGVAGHAGVVFWVVLGLVAAGLLIIITRLLPKHGSL